MTLILGFLTDSLVLPFNDISPLMSGDENGRKTSGTSRRKASAVSATQKGSP